MSEQNMRAKWGRKGTLLNIKSKGMMMAKTAKYEIIFGSWSFHIRIALLDCLKTLVINSKLQY